MTFPDTGKAANKKFGKGEVPIGQFNPNRFKDDFIGQLKVGVEGPNYIHLPMWLKDHSPDLSWFEQLVSERPNNAGRWEKIKSGARNEALDLMVMTHVLAHLHGIQHVNWDRPKPWCAPWDSNTYIYSPDEPIKPASTGSIAKRLA